jgi:hypothetical protein
MPPQSNGHRAWSLLTGQNYTVHDTVLAELTSWKTLRSHHYRYPTHANGSENLKRLANNRLVTTDPGDHAALTGHRRLLLQRMLQAEQLKPCLWPY